MPRKGHVPRRKLSPRQQDFIREYVRNGGNGLQAVVVAGYSPKGAGQTALNLLKSPYVGAAIDEWRALVAKNAELSSTRVLEELRRRALFDPRDLFEILWADEERQTPTGKERVQAKRLRLKDPDEWTPELASAIKSFKVVKKNAFSGDNVIDLVYEITLADKDKSLELLAKHFKLLNDQANIEIHGPAVLMWRDAPEPEALLPEAPVPDTPDAHDPEALDVPTSQAQEALVPARTLRPSVFGTQDPNAQDLASRRPGVFGTSPRPTALARVSGPPAADLPDLDATAVEAPDAPEDRAE
jgi:hypothetical protein